jgi:hypothetical protein
MELFVDGVSQGTASISSTFGNTVNTALGYRQNGANYFDGEIDAVMIKDEAMTSSEIQELYDRQSQNLPGAQYPFSSETASLSFQNISSNSQDFTNNSFWNTTTLDFETFVNATDTNNQINQTYKLYNSSGNLVTSSQYATNNENGLFTLNLQEQSYNISFEAENNETNTSTGNYTFTIDLTPPSINSSFPEILNSSTINVSQYFNCNDASDCHINFQEDNVTLDVSNESYKFTYFVNQSYQIVANDSAGNIDTENGEILINPIQTFRFNDTDRSVLVDGFSFGGFLTENDSINIPLYALGLGNKTLEFVSDGYVKESFDINLTNTSELNNTFNVTPVTIFFDVFKESKPSEGIQFDLTLNNGTDTNFTENIQNYSKFYNETLHGEVKFTYQADGYPKRSVWINITPYSVISQDVYLLNETLSEPIIFQVTNIGGTAPIEDATFNFYTESQGQERFVGQARTDSQGYTYFSMDPLGDYEIVVSKDGYVRQELSSIPGRTEYVIRMQESGTAFDFLFDDFSYRFIPSESTVNGTPFTAGVKVVDQDNKISSMTFEISGQNFTITDTLTQGNGGTINKTVTTISPRYSLKLTVERDGETYEFKKKIDLLNVSKSPTSLKNASDTLKGESNNADRVMMMIFLYIIAVAVGAVFSATAGAVMGLMAITVYAFVGWLSVGFAALVIAFTLAGVLYFQR